MDTQACTNIREPNAEPMDPSGTVQTASISSSSAPASVEEMDMGLDFTDAVPVNSEDPDPEGHSMQASSTVLCPMKAFDVSVEKIAEGKGGSVEVVPTLEVDGEAGRPMADHHHQQKQHSQPKSPRARSARKHKQTQMTDQTVCLVGVNSLGVSETQSDSAISRQEIWSGERLFYGTHIGSETRNLEFKRGGGEYLRSLFRTHVRRYACAFLNSGGGSLLVGVDDDGIVRGICCDHKQEDRARLMVDSILKLFLPPLLPHSYNLTFLPVVRPGPEGVLLKVMRLTLLSPPELSLPSLYQTDQGQVFLRRDGSIDGPLSASAIQEWARQKWSGEVRRLQQCVEALLTEQKLLLQEIHHQSMINSLCLNTLKSQPPDIWERLRRALGRFGSQAAVMPSNARRCQCAQANSASSLLPTVSPPPMAPERATVPSGPSYPGPVQCQQNEQKEAVPVSSICSVIGQDPPGPSQSRLFMCLSGCTELHAPSGQQTVTAL
ncbi:hypothetical protein SRHO_G00015280 [Serrasalmus rhombeus]